VCELTAHLPGRKVAGSISLPEPRFPLHRKRVRLGALPFRASEDIVTATATKSTAQSRRLGPRTTEAARVSALTRHRRPGDPDLAAARAALDALHLRQNVARVVDGAPALTDEQRAQLTAALWGAK
jgi:hypothetical protein